MRGSTAFTLLMVYVLCAVAFHHDGYAQDYSSAHDHDTTLTTLRVFQLPPLFFSLSLLPTEQNSDESPFYPGSLSQQFAIPGHYNSWTVQEGIDLDSPWKVHLEHQREHSTLYSIMGSVSLGGTAYILYRHIKKYGLK